MDRLLIVDDEDIEREGMANLIDWNNYDIEVVGTAWNGLEGLDKIKTLCPDIVMVDMKMPVMNGNEMIHKAREDFPEIVFVVLSGYGDYEFTSRAMEEGVRHYILKPCDEDKIIAVIKKVQEELKERRYHAAQINSARALLPRAREQIFRDLLLGRDQPEIGNTRELITELGGMERNVIVVAFRSEKGFDYLKQFVVNNVMNELLPTDTLLLSTEIQRDVFLLVDMSVSEYLEEAVGRLKEEIRPFEAVPIYSVASGIGTMEELPRLYVQAEELLHWAELEKLDGLLQHGQGGNLTNHAANIFNYQALRAAECYEQILFELHLAIMKMKLRNYTIEQMVRCWQVAWKVFSGDVPIPELTLEGFADAIVAQKGIMLRNDKEGQRNRGILLATYKRINDSNISLQILAKEELFMNEDYLGRIFTKLTGMRFSAFVECRRIELAQRLLQFQPDLKISYLAELVGYPTDGQYFSKVFRKICGKSPSEYRNNL